MVRRGWKEDGNGEKELRMGHETKRRTENGFGEMLVKEKTDPHQITIRTFGKAF